MAAPTVADLSALLGRTVPTGQGEAALNITTMAVRAYVRGGSGWEPNDEQASVILSSAARLVSNASGRRAEALGPESVTYGTFEGFTVGELQTLGRYRVKAQ